MPRAEMAQHEHGEGVCNQRPIACPLCAKTFTLWSHYETHKKCHQKLKQRQYPCQTCGKIFTSASNRNMHQRIHMVSGHSTVHPVESSLGRKLTSRNISGRKDTFRR